MLKKFSIALIVVLVGGWGVHSYLASTAETPRQVFSRIITLQKEPEITIDSIAIVEATNKERVKAGLAPLSVNKLLNNSAEMKVDDMIARQYFEHQSPTGEGVSDLGRKAGYNYVIMGENLAMGAFTSADDIVRAWMESPGHKANILNTKYQDIGVSVKQGVYEGKNVYFAVQHFGTGRGVCPPIDSALKKEIDALNEELQVREGIISGIKRELESPGASTKPSYPSEVQLFNQKVDEYNAKLQTSREKIEIYNGEVKDFNRCIATFQ